MISGFVPNVSGAVGSGRAVFESGHSPALGPTESAPSKLHASRVRDPGPPPYPVPDGPSGRSDPCLRPNAHSSSPEVPVPPRRSLATALLPLALLAPTASAGPDVSHAPRPRPTIDGVRSDAPVPAAPQEAPPSCDSEAHRAFDFWLGRWEVRRPDGTVAGRNTITRILDGCVIHERYRTPRGYAGQSFNIYDRTRDVWHQTWVDRAGTLLLLEGGWRDGAMVLEGERVAEDGSRALHRITWSRIDGDPNRVRQHWVRSSDGGETWSDVFDGRYVRER